MLRGNKKLTPLTPQTDKDSMEDTDSIPWDFLGEPYRQIYELRQELGRIRAQNAMLREELAKLAAKPCIVCDLIDKQPK